MEILTVVVPDLVRYAKEYFLENSLFQHLEHVRKGTLPVAVGPHAVRTMVNGIDYCGSAIQIPNAKQKKCNLIFNQLEKVPLTSEYLAEILEDDAVLTLGKSKDSKLYFLMVDRNPEKTLHVKQITQLFESMVRLTTDLKLRQLIEIEQIRLPVEICGSFIITINCEGPAKRTIELYDENLTQIGFVNGFVWKDIVV